MFDLNEASESFDRAQKEKMARKERLSDQGKVTPTLSSWLPTSSNTNTGSKSSNCQSFISSFFNPQCHTKPPKDNASDVSVCSVNKSGK